jgi:hypothetical protein
MNTIQLNTPVADNGGTRRDAGESVTIGKDAGHIMPARAEALIASGSATENTPPAKLAKTAD